MNRVITRKQDVVWNYVGTVFSMAGEFFLLPVLLFFLTPDELGLWYIYIAVSKLAMLFEFGFSPAFARNLVYVISGSRKLTRFGRDPESIKPGVDWHLLKTVMSACWLIYACVAVLALVLIATVGTAYIATVAGTVMDVTYWASWIIFCVAIFLNLYFLRYITNLRGVGDVAGENKAKTFAKLMQLTLSAVLLTMGTGLVGASIGFLANGVLLRVICRIQWSKHTEIVEGLNSDSKQPTREEVKGVLSAISYIAWRDGVVELSLYATSQATTIICSLFLTLAETGSYSIMLQLGTAVYLFSGTYMRSCFPAYQSACARGDRNERIRIVQRGTASYLALFAVSVIGIIAIVFPILTMVRNTAHLESSVFLLLCIYLLLWYQHSLYCSLIISNNEIPYMRAYLVTAVAGVLLSSMLMGCFQLGLWGLVLGQFIPQLFYNNWRWPKWVVDSLETTYFSSVIEGFRWLFGKIKLRKESNVF